MNVLFMFLEVVHNPALAVLLLDTLKGFSLFGWRFLAVRSL